MTSLLKRFENVVQNKDIEGLDSLNAVELVMIGTNTIVRHLIANRWADGYNRIKKKCHYLDMYVPEDVDITDESQLLFYQEVKVRPRFVVYCMLDFSDEAQDYIKTGPYTETVMKKFKR